MSSIGKKSEIGQQQAVDELVFQLHIYFATCSLCKQKGSVRAFSLLSNWLLPTMAINLLTLVQEYGESQRQAMERLKQYLEKGSGAKFSDSPQFAPYFALPYVTKPKTHPLFKEVIQVGHPVSYDIQLLFSLFYGQFGSGSSRCGVDSRING